MPEDLDAQYERVMEWLKGKTTHISHVRDFNGATDALSLLERMKEENDALKQFVEDTITDMECEPDCDSLSHSYLCPVENEVVAWRRLREELERLKKERDEAYTFACCGNPFFDGALVVIRDGRVYEAVCFNPPQTEGEQQ